MSKRPVQCFPRMRTTEILPLTYDFTDELPSGVTLSSAGTTVATEADDSDVTDATPTDIVSGAASVTGSNLKVTQTIDGTQAVDGTKYFLVFQGTGSDSKTYEGEAVVLIKDVNTDRYEY